MGYKHIIDYDFTSAPTNITVVKLGKEDMVEYTPLGYDDEKKEARYRWFGVIINGELLCFYRQYANQSKLTPTLLRYTKKEAWAVVNMFKRLNYPFPYQVCSFEYNGFFGKGDDKVVMPYTARFKQWSGDPGIAIMSCSDGEERHIPTYAMKHSFETMPNDLTRVQGSGHTTFFGSASKSN